MRTGRVKRSIYKSCITFSPNVREDVKSVVQSTLGLVAVQSNDRYLGLLTLVGKNKRTFNDIKERVWNKVRTLVVLFRVRCGCEN